SVMQLSYAFLTGPDKTLKATLKQLLIDTSRSVLASANCAAASGNNSVGSNTEKPYFLTNTFVSFCASDRSAGTFGIDDAATRDVFSARGFLLEIYVSLDLVMSSRPPPIVIFEIPRNVNLILLTIVKVIDSRCIQRQHCIRIIFRLVSRYKLSYEFIDSRLPC